MAYYMAARKGLDSLMDGSLPQSATVTPEVLRSAARGLTVLRELELNETCYLVLGQSNSCSSPNCPSRNTTGPRVSDAHKKVVKRITDSSRSATKVLEVLSLRGVAEIESTGFCESCVKGWEDGHAEVRRKAWDILPHAFGLRVESTS
jgi:hypothetical protein